METRERTKETFPALWLLGCKSDSRSGGKNCIEWGEGFDRRDLPRDWGRHVQLCKRGLEPGPHPRYQVSLEWILPVELSAGNGLSVLPYLLLGCFFTIACSIICKLFASAQLLSVLNSARKHFSAWWDHSLSGFPKSKQKNTFRFCVC